MKTNNHAEEIQAAEDIDMKDLKQPPQAQPLPLLGISGRAATVVPGASPRSTDPFLHTETTAHTVASEARCESVGLGEVGCLRSRRGRGKESEVVRGAWRFVVVKERRVRWLGFWENKERRSRGGEENA
ncbi:hypothetical protein Droror1_Dr00027670 [Drosera rotundifolia]